MVTPPVFHLARFVIEIVYQLDMALKKIYDAQLANRKARQEKTGNNSHKIFLYM